MNRLTKILDDLAGTRGASDASIERAYRAIVKMFAGIDTRCVHYPNCIMLIEDGDCGSACPFTRPAGLNRGRINPETEKE